MTPKQIRTRDVPRSHYTTYLKKAKEFLGAMNASLASGGWDAVGLNAAHCAISAADAVLVHVAGKRCAGESHGDLLFLPGFSNIPARRHHNPNPVKFVRCGGGVAVGIGHRPMRGG